jgi:predicted lipoprotein with Yx(FWY)xxD motif
MERRTTAVLAAVAGLVLLAAAIGPAAFGAANTVDTAAIMVKGVSTKVLTDAKGMTLYYVTSDTPATSSCTEGCAKIWPPLLSTAAPAAGEPLPGKLALVKTANGSQVSYNGHLLYVYSGDSAPHQANGQGVAGKWWVAKVDLKPAAAGGSGQPKPSNSGYGNGGW